MSINSLGRMLTKKDSTEWICLNTPEIHNNERNIQILGLHSKTGNLHYGLGKSN
jgi:hypothetical protein